MSITLQAAAHGTYDGTPRNLVQLAAQSASISLRNQETDALSIVTDHPYDIDPADPSVADLFAIMRPGGIVAVADGAGVIFRGRPSAPRRHADAGGEYLAFDLHGPWRDLENLPVFSSYTDAVTGNTQTQPSLHLEGTAPDMVAAVLGCLPAGRITAGTIDLPGIDLPPRTLEHTTIAAALRQILAYLPGSLVAFDYADATPVMHILKADSTHIETVLPPPEPGEVLAYSLAKPMMDVTQVHLHYVRDVVGPQKELLGKTRVALDSSTALGGSLPETPLHVEHKLAPPIMSYPVKRVGFFPSGPHSLADLIDFSGGGGTYDFFFVGMVVCWGTNMELYEEASRATPYPGKPYCVYRNVHTPVPVGHDVEYPGSGSVFVIYRYDDPAAPERWLKWPDPSVAVNPDFRMWDITLQAGFRADPHSPTPEISTSRTIRVFALIGGGTPDQLVDYFHQMQPAEGEPEPVPGPGIAQRIHDDLSRPFHTGQMGGVPLAVAPLARYIEIDSLTSPVQHVRHDLGTRTTHYQFGPPARLFPQDYIALARTMKRT